MRLLDVVPASQVIQQANDEVFTLLKEGYEKLESPSSNVQKQ
jgi:hypothetical protein